MWEKGNKGEFPSNGIKYSCGMCSDWCTKRRKETPQELYWLGWSPLSDLQKMQCMKTVFKN